MIKFGAPAGLAIRVQGINRYYAVTFTADKRINIVKARDAHRSILSSAAFPWELDCKYRVTLVAHGKIIVARVGDTELRSVDGEYGRGGIGLIATDGCVSADCFVFS
jgi:hypothetical protein